MPNGFVLAERLEINNRDNIWQFLTHNGHASTFFFLQKKKKSFAKLKLVLKKIILTKIAVLKLKFLSP